MAERNSSSYEMVPDRPRPIALAIVELPVLYARALFAPVARMYEAEGKRAGWGIVWVQLVILIIVPGVLGLLRGLHRSATVTGITNSQALYNAIASIAVGTSIVATLIQVLVVPVIFFIGVGVQYLVAKAFRGNALFVEQAYTTLLYAVPLAVVSGIISTVLVFFVHLSLRIVIVPVITVALFIYGILLNIVAIEGVHRLTRARATTVVLLPYIIGVLLACGLTFYLAHFIISAVHNIR